MFHIHTCVRWIKKTMKEEKWNSFRYMTHRVHEMYTDMLGASTCENIAPLFIVHVPHHYRKHTQSQTHAHTQHTTEHVYSKKTVYYVCTLTYGVCYWLTLWPRQEYRVCPDIEPVPALPVCLCRTPSYQTCSWTTMKKHTHNAPCEDPKYLTYNANRYIQIECRIQCLYSMCRCR